MKVLLDHTLPFLLAHGGAQTQIEMTRQGLERAGLEVEWLRWWDDKQGGDLIHLFAPANFAYLALARQKGLPTVLTTLLTGECNHSAARLRAKRWKLALLQKLPGFRGINAALPWRTLHECTLNVVGLAAEKQVLEQVYRVPAERVTQVPLGLQDAFLQAPPGGRQGDFLISTGTITPRKRSLELARLAQQAQTPVLFVGKPYCEDAYWREFQTCIDGRWVHHHAHVSSQSEMIELYRSARGFVLASEMENWCLSAHEAAACGLPCLLRAQRWAQERFGDQASYLTDDPRRDAVILRDFYRRAPSLPAPAIRQWSWWEVGERLAEVYRNLLAGKPTSS